MLRVRIFLLGMFGAFYLIKGDPYAKKSFRSLITSNAEDLGCADGSTEQVFMEGKMVGCDGGYTKNNFRSACAVGWHVATASDYFANGGTTIVPNAMRWVDVTWDGNGHEVSFENWQGYYDSPNSGGNFTGLSQNGHCTWVSTNERCELSFANKHYGIAYGCHCRGGHPDSTARGVVCAKATTSRRVQASYSGSTAVVVRDGFRFQCQLWDGDLCVQPYWAPPLTSISGSCSVPSSEVADLRPVWHGDTAAQCQLLCWIATGSSECVAHQSNGESHTATGWTYTDTGSDCSTTGRQHVTISGGGLSQDWSLDASSWSRSGSLSAYQCNWRNSYEASSWHRTQDKHCGNHVLGSAYTTIADAISACSQNSQCNGVYDDSCNDGGSHYMCDSDHEWEDSTAGSCVYLKPAPAVNVSCGSITHRRDCYSEVGRVLLEATGPTSCQQACVASGTSGCCEWQTDWEYCFIVPDATTKSGYSDRYATVCSEPTRTTTIVSSLSTSSCDVMESSGAGDDGGLIWFDPNNNRLFYEGDDGVVAVEVNNWNSIVWSTPLHYESVHADPSYGQTYQLLTASFDAVASSETLSIIACLDSSLNAQAYVSLEYSITLGTYKVFIGGGELALTDSNGVWYIVSLACSGTLSIRRLGSGSDFTIETCERGRQGGILEYAGGYYVIYPRSGSIYRMPIPAGSPEETVLSASLGDICSFTVDFARQRWYYHYENGDGYSEPLYSCPATLLQAPTPASMTPSPTQSPTASPTQSPTPSPAQALLWIEHELKQCYDHRLTETFSTHNDAKDRCLQLASCWGVYDNGCDEGANDVFLCDANSISSVANLPTSSSSCVFEKTSEANLALQNLGSTGCTPSNKCSSCQGDCDSDSDCASGLTCFQRSSSAELVPGCSPGGSGDVDAYDYCFQAFSTGWRDLGSDSGDWSAGSNAINGYHNMVDTAQQCQRLCEANPTCIYIHWCAQDNSDPDRRGECWGFTQVASAPRASGCNAHENYVKTPSPTPSPTQTSSPTPSPSPSPTQASAPTRRRRAPTRRRRTASAPTRRRRAPTRRRRTDSTCSVGYYMRRRDTSCSACSGYVRRRRSAYCTSCASGQASISGSDDCGQANRITSDGTQQRPHCSWSSSCTWDAATQTICAVKLCEASGYTSGNFVTASNDMCTTSFTSSSHYHYNVYSGTFESKNKENEAQIIADCQTPSPSPTPSPTMLQDCASVMEAARDFITSGTGDGCLAFEVIASNWDNGCAELFYEAEVELGFKACLAASGCLKHSLGPIKGVCWSKCENTVNAANVTVTECQNSMLDKAGLNHDRVCGKKENDELAFNRMGFMEILILTTLSIVCVTLSTIYGAISTIVAQKRNPGNKNLHLIDRVFYLIDIAAASYASVGLINAGALQNKNNGACGFLNLAGVAMHGPMLLAMFSIVNKRLSKRVADAINQAVMPVYRFICKREYDQCKDQKQEENDSVDIGAVCQSVSESHWGQWKDRIVALSGDQIVWRHDIPQPQPIPKEAFPVQIKLFVNKRFPKEAIPKAFKHTQVKPDSCVDRIKQDWKEVYCLNVMTGVVSLVFGWPAFMWYISMMAAFAALSISSFWGIVAFIHISLVGAIGLPCLVCTVVCAIALMHCPCVMWVKRGLDEGEYECIWKVLNERDAQVKKSLYIAAAPLILVVAFPLLFAFLLYVHGDWHLCHNAFFDEFSVSAIVMPDVDFDLQLFGSTFADIVTLQFRGFNTDISQQGLTNFLLVSNALYVIAKCVQVIMQCLWSARHSCLHQQASAVPANLKTSPEGNSQKEENPEGNSQKEENPTADKIGVASQSEDHEDMTV